MSCGLGWGEEGRTGDPAVKVERRLILWREDQRSTLVTLEDEEPLDVPRGKEIQNKRRTACWRGFRGRNGDQAM